VLEALRQKNYKNFLKEAKEILQVVEQVSELIGNDSICNFPWRQEEEDGCIHAFFIVDESR
jgi:hypothetical protein